MSKYVLFPPNCYGELILTYSATYGLQASSLLDQAKPNQTKQRFTPKGLYSQLAELSFEPNFIFLLTLQSPVKEFV